MGDGNQGNQDEDAIWLLNMKEKMDGVPPLNSNWSICEVPSNLRDVNPTAYSPQILSIGPLHHGKDNLRSMETQKTQYTRDLFRRTHDPVETFDACGKAILGLVENIRACYKEPLTKFSEDKELAEILLFDGCFILELFQRYSSNVHQNDPIFTTSWMIPSLQRDLALLENQIPLIVLEALYFNVTETCSPATQFQYPLKELALYFFQSAAGIEPETIQKASRQSSNHLLHLLHNCYVPTSPKIVPPSNEELDPIACATALAECGIKFRRDTKTKNILDLSFDKGVFTVPTLVIHDLTDSLFRNLIAFEQCFHRDAQYVASYVLLMDHLVDTAADVELLDRKDIIKNHLGGGDDASEFLNNICRQVAVEKFYFEDLSKNVNLYCENKLHKYRADLIRNYFHNPWAIISFVAAIVLLVLTFLQTIYSIMSYY